MAGSAVYGGLDIGGTKTHAIVTDARGAILAEHTVPTGTGPDEVVTGALTAIRTAVAQLGPTSPRLQTLGVGIPGRVDTATGLVSHAVNLEVVELALGPLLAAALDVPVTVDNDVNAASLGAARYLGTVRTSLSYLNVGTGLALSTVQDGTILRGSGGFAGEIGHLPLSGSGIRCACGQLGCLETIASGAGMLRRWRAVHPEGTTAELDDCAAAGDPAAVAIWRDLVRGAALAIQVTVLTLDPAVVALGGGLAQGRHDLLGLVVTDLTASASASPFLASLEIPSRLRLIPKSAHAAAAGAVSLGRSTANDPVHALR